MPLLHCSVCSILTLSHLSAFIIRSFIDCFVDFAYGSGSTSNVERHIDRMVPTVRPPALVDGHQRLSWLPSRRWHLPLKELFRQRLKVKLKGSLSSRRLQKTLHERVPKQRKLTAGFFCISSGFNAHGLLAKSQTCADAVYQRNH